jgi:hypothetical protein
MDAGPGPEHDDYSEFELLLDPDLDAEPAAKDAGGDPAADEPAEDEPAADEQAADAGAALERDLPSDQEAESGPAGDE